MQQILALSHNDDTLKGAKNGRTMKPGAIEKINSLAKNYAKKFALPLGVCFVDQIFALLASPYGIQLMRLSS